MSSKNDSLIVAVAKQLQMVGITTVLFYFTSHGNSEGDFVNSIKYNYFLDLTYSIFAHKKDG